MSKIQTFRRVLVLICLIFFWLFLVVLLSSLPSFIAQADESQANQDCADGPEFDGIPLDQCYVETFNVGGESKSITVWYTLDQTPKPVEIDPGPPATVITRTHGISSPDQVQRGAQLGREAWETYYRVFGRSPRDTGPNCDGNIDVWVYDTAPWPSTAPWPNMIDDCRIKINVRRLEGDASYAFYHEFFHYLQFAFNEGCYDFQFETAVQGIWKGSDDFSEGYADLATDIISQTRDDNSFVGFVNEHRHWRSIYNESYWNLFNKYFAEQVGTQWTTADPEYHMDAVRKHYLECDAQDTMYVLEDLVPQLTNGTLTMDELVLNFFAANYAYRWVDFATYPELFYVDHGTPDYGLVRHIETVNLTDTHSWHGDFILTDQEDGLLTNFEGGSLPADLSPMPQQWAAYYYLAQPQPGCDYVNAHVEGEPGARLGINLIAHNANPSVDNEFQRVSWIGQELSRTFSRRSNNFPILAIINSFDSIHEYDVSFQCVTPQVVIREPRQVDFTLVGLPASPSTFLLRFEVRSDGSPVRGLVESDFEVKISGQAASLVPGTFQEVGQEYWVIVQPPSMSAGTTWADMEVVLNGGISDAEDQSILYVEPGHNDLVLLFDASNSMDIEDVGGEGKRYENAQKAGTVVADLLSEGDRVAVMDFSATGNTPSSHDIRTLLPLKEVIFGTIDEVKDAIDLVSPRYFTPIGQALVDAKKELLSVTGSVNPKSIILLSDGEENVSPFYDEIASELDAAGVAIDTIGLSGDADEELLARIAAENSGTYRHVPTSPNATINMDTRQRAKLASLGLPENITSRLATTVLPGPLGLDEVYDYLETKNQGASRLFVENHTAVPSEQWVTASQYVDKNAVQLRLVVASKQPDTGLPQCLELQRTVEVLPPGADPFTGWISINPLSNLPLGWHGRNSLYDDVLVVDGPAAGNWQLRAKGWLGYCLNTNPGPSATQAQTFDFMISASIQSDTRLQGRFLAPVMDGQARLGDHIPIVATLLNDDGGVTGATVIAVVAKPLATVVVPLVDDGKHGDGAPEDGIYGGMFGQTDQGGTYNVRILASWQEGGTGGWLAREWTGAFYVRGLQQPSDDADQDSMPDWWEESHGLDPTRDDALDDLDLDGLKNIYELQVGSRPNQADTDHGGENDYTEAVGGRNPLNPDDDMVDKMGVVTTVVYNGTVVLHWPYADRFGNMQLWLSTDPDQKGSLTYIGTSGVYTVTGLTNDTTYFLRLAPLGLAGGSVGSLTPPVPVTPKADPNAPNGTIWINDGAASTNSKLVTLTINASDIPLDGPSFAASGAVSNHWTRALNEVSGGIEMRLSNETSFADATWEPYSFQKPWILGAPDGKVYRVYGQFRDAAGNLSSVVWDDILFTENQNLYLPLINRNR